MIWGPKHYIDSFNSSLAFFGLSSPIEKLQDFKFPQNTTSGFLSSRYLTSATLISPLDNSVSVDLTPTSEEFAGVYVQSSKSQTIKVKLNYDNKELGIKQDIIVDIDVVADAVPLSAYVRYIVRNRDVEFRLLNNRTGEEINGTNYTFKWDYGDGLQATTTSSTNIHRYGNEGAYLATVRVYNSNNILVLVEVALVIADTSVLTICYDPNSPYKPVFQTTAISGFTHQIEIENYGTCYQKYPAVSYPQYNQDCVSLYNCTIYGLIP